MKTKFLQLKKPCQENWESMTPQDQGRYCQQCAKNVLDLSQASMLEIAQALKENNGSLCARITQKQLNTPVFLLSEKTQPSQSSFAKVGMALLVAGALSASSCHLGETVKPVSETIIQVPTAQTKKLEQDASANKNSKAKPFLFKGKVTSEKTGKPMERARVLFVTIHEVYSTHTLEDGTFELEIPTRLINAENIITFSFDHIIKRQSGSNGVLEIDHYFYEDEAITLSKEEMNNYLNLEAKTLSMILGGIGLHDEERKDPLVIKCGSEISYEEFFETARIPYNNCNTAGNEYFHLPPDIAIKLYGTKAKDGLILIPKVIRQD